MSRNASHLVLPLPRAAYLRAPEGLITALAWREYSLDTSLRPTSPGPRLTVLESGELKGKVIFRPTANSSTSKSPVTTTAPSSAEETKAFGAALKAAGILSSHDQTVIGEAFVHGISGVSSAKGKGQASSPMTPSLALLQNVAGVHAALRPPNLGRTIELLQILGASTVPPLTASQAWATAAEQRLSMDPLLRVVDAAVNASLLPSGRIRRSASRLEESENWAGLFPQSPFSWFSRMWPKITSSEWVEALPARVWTDWATTVLRLAFGASYLWEASWYESMARVVLSDEAPTWERIREEMPPVLVWRSASAATSVRDLAPVLMRRVHRSTLIMREIEGWIDQGRQHLEADKALAEMHADGDLRRTLVKALSSNENSSTGNSIWEAIKYVLKVRDPFGEYADHYGLLRQNNRYLTVEPRTEWAAVVASLSCDGPHGECTVGSIMADLEELGIRPEMIDLIALLERAGLARGSADADQGVRVRSAF